MSLQYEPASEPLHISVKYDLIDGADQLHLRGHDPLERQTGQISCGGQQPNAELNGS